MILCFDLAIKTSYGLTKLRKCFQFTNLKLHGIIWLRVTYTINLELLVEEDQNMNCLGALKRLVCGVPNTANAKAAG